MKPDPNSFRIGPVGGGGPAVLCVHGLTGTPWEVRPPAEALADAGFACLGPLLPGHGTDPVDLLQIRSRDWVDALLHWYDRLAEEHERVYVVGLSLGGLLTLALAQRRALAGAVVVAAPLTLGRMIDSAVPMLSRVVRFLPKPHAAILDDEARAVHPGYKRMPLPAVHQLLQLARLVEPELGRIQAPLQLIYSRRDPTVPFVNADRVRSGLRTRHELHVLEDSSHVIPVDRERERVAALIVDFLSGLEKAGH